MLFCQSTLGVLVLFLLLLVLGCPLYLLWLACCKWLIFILSSTWLFLHSDCPGLAGNWKRSLHLDRSCFLGAIVSWKIFNWELQVHLFFWRWLKERFQIDQCIHTSIGTLTRFVWWTRASTCNSAINSFDALISIFLIAKRYIHPAIRPPLHILSIFSSIHVKKFHLTFLLISA